MKKKSEKTKISKISNSKDFQGEWNPAPKKEEVHAIIDSLNKKNSFEKIEELSDKNDFSLKKEVSTQFEIVEEVKADSTKLEEFHEQKIDYTILSNELKESLKLTVQTQDFLNSERTMEWKKTRKGILNMGNYCYMNSAFQIFLSQRQFIHEVLKLRFSEEWMLEESCELLKQYFFLEFIEVILAMEYENNQPLDISSFKKCLDYCFTQFRGNVQCDVHEFLLIFLSTLEEIITLTLKNMKILNEDNPNEFKSKNPILKYFSGQIQITKKSLDQNQTENEKELFFCLSLPIPHREEEKLFEVFLIPYKTDIPILKTKCRCSINQTFSELFLEIFEKNSIEFCFQKYAVFIGTEEIIIRKVHFQEENVWSVLNECQISKKSLLIYELPNDDLNNENDFFFTFIHLSSEKVNKNLMGIKTKTNLSLPILLNFQRPPESKHEFLRHLINKIGPQLGLSEETILEEQKVSLNEEKGENDVNVKEETILIKRSIFCFDGRMKFLKNFKGNLSCGMCNKKACESCSISLSEDETFCESFFHNLEVEIFFEEKMVNQSLKSISKNMVSSNTGGLLGPASVESCLDAFLNTEMIQVDDKNESKTLHISSKIVDFPNFLILQLKRFKNNQSKNEALVTFNEKLEYFSNVNYSLIGIICHEGDLTKGHYYCFCKEDSLWFEYNDSIFKAKDFKTINFKLAYILVYKKAN